MNKNKIILTVNTKFTLSLLVTIFLLGSSKITIAQTLNIDSTKPKNNSPYFTFIPITELEFKNAIKKNYNAHFVSEIGDSSKLAKSLEAIEKTYNVDEIELAKNELCSSPRCLTSFKAYYPTLDLYLFNIKNNHYVNACFVFASSNEMASSKRRFRGEFGVMSKDGLWVGMERGDCDNYTQIEICKSSKIGVWSTFRFDFTGLDINDEEPSAMFWAEKNIIFIATKEYEKYYKKIMLKYYAIRFEI